MRWLVEVTSIDKTDSQSVTVEAESWQRALQSARAQRGESGPISGFSIELLDDGYRAVDPMARLRYVVKRARTEELLRNALSVLADNGLTLLELAPLLTNAAFDGFLDRVFSPTLNLDDVPVLGVLGRSLLGHRVGGRGHFMLGVGCGYMLTRFGIGPFVMA